MQRFRSAKTLQKFTSVHAQVHNHFNQERHLVTSEIYKQRLSAALAEMARSHGLILLWNFVLSRQTEVERQSVPILSDRACRSVETRRYETNLPFLMRIP
jgi:hypothetical protein